MSTDRRTTRRRMLQGLVGLGVGTFTGSGAWGYFYERHHLVVMRQDVPVAGLPAALEGVRIALLTDIHRSQTVSEDLVRRAVALTQRESPDLIVLGGDYVTWGDRRYVEPAADALAGLAATSGVFAILGNHDDDRHMPAALARRGYQVLRDARTTVTIRGIPVDLIGLRFWTRRAPDIERVIGEPSGFPILLAHDPRRFADAARLGLPLVLSGHTHGGQVRLPIVYPVATRKFPVVAGMAFEADTTLYVSKGIGTVYVPIRVNCPPEVVLLTLNVRRPGQPRPALEA